MKSNKPLLRLGKYSDLQAAFALMAELGYPDLSLERFTTVYAAVLSDPSTSILFAEAGKWRDLRASINLQSTST